MNLARRADLTPHRADVEYHAAVNGQHMPPERFLRAVEYAAEVGVEHSAPVIISEVGEQLLLSYACVVNQDINAAESFVNLVKHSVDALSVFDVRLNRDRLYAAALLELSG